MTRTPRNHRGHSAGAALLAVAVALVLALVLPRPAPASGSDEEAASTDFGVVKDLGPPAGAPLSGEQLDAATKDLSTRLRCPVCQGLSVADSTAVSALAMRDEIRELFAKGYSEEQIVAYFESSFGEFVLLIPKARGFNLLVWLLPVAGLLTGLAIVLRQTRAQRVADPASAPADENDELADYRARVLREVDRSGRSAE